MIHSKGGVVGSKTLGFTLIELVAVLAIVGILAAVALPKKESDANIAIPFQARKLATDIRRLQIQAMATSTPLCLVTTASNYKVTAWSGGTCSTTQKEPGTTADWVVSLTSGITLTVTSLGFDSVGEPRTLSTAAPISNSATLALTTPQKTYNLTVSPLTGYVKVTP